MIAEMGSTMSRSGHEELEKFDRYFKSGNLAVESGIPDDAMAYAYTRFRKEDLVPIIFHDHPNIGIYDFITWYRNPALNTLGAYAENQETMKWDLQGMLWTLDVTAIGPYKKTTVGMGFFRGGDRNQILRFAQLGLAWCFGKLGVDVVHGSTPVSNRAAVLFGQKLGFDQTTPLDGGCLFNGELQPVILSSMTREKWDKQHSPWKVYTT